MAKKGQRIIGSHGSLIDAIRSAQRKRKSYEVIILAGRKVHLMPKKAFKRKALKYL